MATTPARLGRDHLLTAVLLTVALVGATGCEAVGLAPNKPDLEAVKEDPGTREPDRVVVHHILISFAESGLATVTRSEEEARVLAANVYRRAKAEGGVGGLVYLYSDDVGPSAPKDGRYAIANFGVRPASPGEVERTALVPGFGDASFALAVGELTLLEYDAQNSPYGWHIIERVK